MPANKQYSNLKNFPYWVVVIGLMFLLPATAWSMEDHQNFGELLVKYNRKGVVDYAGFKKEETRLDAYLDELAKIKPDTLSRNDRFAFYANAYNAWTIKLILSGYPGVESIKDLGSFFKSPWKKEFVRIGGRIITLDSIEHDILRPQFKDPRVHVAVNCASKSCPSLWGEPFIGNRLDAQLNAATRAFINNPKFNRIENNTLYVSRIFKWFSEDFNDDIIGFFEQYASGELKNTITARRSSLEVEYLDYDWSLNGN
jgi:hypothetical protein